MGKSLSLKRVISEDLKVCADLRPSGETPEEFADPRTKGLYLRVTKTGEHVWFVRTTNFEGKQVKANFGMILPSRTASAAGAGKYPVYKRIEDVRLQANIEIAALKTPPVVKKDLRTSIDEYLKLSLAKGDHKKSTSAEYRRLYNKALAVYGHHDIWTELSPSFWDELYAGLVLSPIDPKLSVDLREQLENSNFGSHPLLNKKTRFFGKSQAHKIMQLTSGMYTYYCALDTSKDHPIKQFTSTRKGNKQSYYKLPLPRENTLHPRDFKKFIDSMDYVEKHGKIKTKPLLLCLFMGLRPAASTNLRIDDFNLDAKIAWIDGDTDGFKRTDANAIPVATWVINHIVKPQIEMARSKGADTEYLTPNLHDYTKPASSDYSGLMDSLHRYNQILTPNGKRLMPSDLRRTFGTYAKFVSNGDETIWKRLMTHTVSGTTTTAPLTKHYYITHANGLRIYVEKIARFFLEYAEIVPLRQETYTLLYELGENEFAEHLRAKWPDQGIVDYVSPAVE